jgi:glycosyltransferase involved in cell wall biosynthesis
MRILYNTYPMAFHTPGGGEIQLKAYRHYLTQRGVQVDLLDLWNPDFLSYDVVHYFSVVGGSEHFCDFVKKLKIPLFVTSSLWISEETKDLYPCQQIKHQLSLADRIITNSNLESHQLSRVFDLPIEKFSVVYNGVDSIFFEPASPDIFRRHFHIDDPFVLNVGNIEPRKNQLRLLHALKKYPDLKLVSIGHIRDEAYGKQCRDVGKSQFVFLGPLDHWDPLLRSAYAACELFALPSTLETPGLAALEAAAQGAKIVVTAVGSAREYFDDLAWYVMDPEEVDEMVEKLAQALLCKNLRLSQRLRQRIKQQFSWDHTLQALYRNYLKNLQ